MIQRSFIVLLLVFAAIFRLSGQDILKSGDLNNEDNSLELHKNSSGLIDFVKATYHPGEGIIEQRSLDVAEEASGIHGIGIVTGTRIKHLDEATYSIYAESGFPAIVHFEKQAIRLMLGKESYLISKPNNYLIEVWPIEADGSISTNKRFAYGVAKDRGNEKCFLGIIERSYEPHFDNSSKSEDYKYYDWQGVNYPKVLTFSDGKLESLVYSLIGVDNEYPYFSYSYAVSFSKDRAINIKNYLILMTQRENLMVNQLIHPVLLTLLFFDAIVQ